jgi:hypothetical protein
MWLSGQLKCETLITEFKLITSYSSDLLVALIRSMELYNNINNNNCQSNINTVL